MKVVCLAAPACSRRSMMGAGIALALPRVALAYGITLTPEAFGARGDGMTNDTLAFAALATEVNRRGGAVIALRPVTYLVGRQRSGKRDYAFEPAPILQFIKCSGPLIIYGNGARLRCTAGLRYGTFDPSTGDPSRHLMPYLKAGQLATPYQAMIHVEGCSGPIEITDLELDGNSESQRIGGQYGDVGWQIPASGIRLVNNSGSETLSRIYSHHHLLDGILVDGADRRVSVSRFSSVRCEHNGRQGCSITGGRNYIFSDCIFADTGRAGLSSHPGAGVDIEPEAGKAVRNLAFQRCTFSNNIGAGLVADSGDSAGATFDGCTFIGTTNWSAWPNKPRFRFTRCTFVGALVHAFGDPAPDRACQFHGCMFRDDPRLAPNRLVYGGTNPSRPIADLPDNKNVLFDHCDFRLTDRLVLPWTTNVTIFSNCRMSQRSATRSYPRGTFIGRNLISGNVDLYSARFEGELVVNGRRLH